MSEESIWTEEKAICSFSGPNYEFLSNFHPVQIESEGIVYPSLEHAYHAAKTLVPAEKEAVRVHPSKGLKKFSKSLTMRSNWEECKIDVMRGLLRIKFSNHAELRGRLLATRGQTLVEGNWWKDNFWGAVREGNKPQNPLIGCNWLGILLMEVREELNQQNADAIPILRASIRRNGPIGLDVTVKSAVGPARMLAPTWDMVMGHKNGALSDEAYTKLYVKILDAVDPDAWRALNEFAKSKGYLRLLCYCRLDKFCHTRLLAEYMAERWPDAYSYRADEVPFERDK